MEKEKIKITRGFVLTVSAFAILAFILFFAIITLAIKSQNDSDESFEESLFDYTEINSELQIDTVSDLIDESIEDFVDVSADSNAPDISDVSDIVEEIDEIEHGWFINEFGYTYVYNGCGYVQFNYKASALERYVKTLNNFSSIVPTDTRIYSITVPVVTTFADIPREIYVEDNFYNQAQSTFVATVASKTDERIIHVPIVDSLEHGYDNNDYVYYKTDKNWTANGAYLAYVEFCKYADLEALPISSFEKNTVQDFLGSFYQATKLNAMKNSPDEYVFYSPVNSVKTALTIYDNGMVYTNYSVCGNKINPNAPHYVILGRDAERYEINTTTTGGSLLIVGDESVSAMVPFLLSHYNRIEIINPDRFKTSFEDYFDNRSYDDCLLMYYSTNSISGDCIPTLNSLTGATENG